MKLELDSRLRAFAAVARQRSFSRAAEELLISQPAVSHHIAELEKDLGILLVTRRAQEVGLTPAGEFLAHFVLRAEALLAQAYQGLKAYARVTPASLHLAASVTPGNYLLPAILPAFQQPHPEVTVSLLLGTSNLVIDAVRTHRAELGIVGGLARVDEIQVEPVYEDEIVLIGTAPRDLRGFTWQVVEAAWQDLGILPQAHIELPSWEAIKLAVASGAGIAACSRLAVGLELKAGTLVVLDAPRWKIQRAISLVRLAGVDLSPEAGWFWEMVVQRWKEG